MKSLIHRGENETFVKVPSVHRSQMSRETFGFLRLFLASLVIVSHVPEIVAGDRRSELLTKLFGTISFGDLAVNGFFFISGFLITGSYLNSRSVSQYLKKRIARIFPAFIVASVICLLVFVPLGGGYLRLSANHLAEDFAYLFTLQPPFNDSAFRDTNFPMLNAPMWTIAHEFKCYLLVIGLGYFGIVRSKLAIAMLTTIVFAVHLILLSSGSDNQLLNIVDPVSLRPSVRFLFELIDSLLFGQLTDAFRLYGIFLCGVLFYNLRDHIKISGKIASVAATLTIACLCFRQSANIGVGLFGGVVIIYLARRAVGTFVGRVNERNDISYGVYLYAWPVTKTLLWYWPAMPIILAIAATFITAAGLGWLSWKLVEKPALMTIRR